MFPCIYMHIHYAIGFILWSREKVDSWKSLITMFTKFLLFYLKYKLNALSSALGTYFPSI